MCFRKKTSTVRRRYNEFIWLRNSLENNALIMYVPQMCLVLYLFMPLLNFLALLQRNTQVASLEAFL